MNKLLFSFIIIAVFASCSDEKKVDHNNLYFANNFDDMRGWIQNDKIIKGKAHSGKYYSKTDSINLFSFAFNMGIGNLTQKTLKKADVTLWANVKDEKYAGSIVTSINRGDSTIFWDSSNLKFFYKKTGEWFEAKATFNYPSKVRKTDIVKIYLWNSNGKSEIDMDDIEIQFYE